MKLELGKTYLTRDGRKARCICTDVRGTVFSAICVVEDFDGICESAKSYRLNGSFNELKTQTHLDLVQECTPWDDIPIDAPVIAHYADGVSVPRHFAYVKDGVPYVWPNGTTSHTKQDKPVRCTACEKVKKDEDS